MTENIHKYAKFLIQGCLGLKENSKLFIIGSNFIQEFIDIVIKEAHALGIWDIETLITDYEALKELYLTNDYDNIIKSPLVSKEKYNEMARQDYAFLNLISPVPNYFADVNHELLIKVSQYQTKSIQEYRQKQAQGLLKWNISAVANPLWAKKLFQTPDTSKLWNLIFDICLINTPNPLQAWEDKLNLLAKRADYLNSLKIRKLIYHNALGTNLEIGLPDDYLFATAKEQNIVNMPSEEIFTSPHRLKVNGTVYSSKVLIHDEQSIENFYLTFKDGKVIDFHAQKGEDILRGIIQTDTGASYLGEVALVDYDSPISQANIIFQTTLYDENASCHLALGEGFAECLKDGLSKSTNELLDLGINVSQIHVDFFIGTPDLKIEAILSNGQKLDIMNNGNFVWEENK